MEGKAEVALNLRTDDSVSEVLCKAKVEAFSPRYLRPVLRECFKEAKEKGLAGELRVRAWTRVGGLAGE